MKNCCVSKSQTKQYATTQHNAKKKRPGLDKLGDNKILKNFELFFSNHRFLFSVLINIILFTLFFVLFTPRFAINDDPAMMRIASGELLGEPNEHLIFINVIIGHFLKYMYTILPQWNWYVILFYACHFFSMVAVLYVFLRNQFSFYNVLLFLLLFAFVEVHFLTNLQFTTTAFVTGISGFLILYSTGFMEAKDKWHGIIAGIILLVLSGLIRSQVFNALLLLWVPLILYRAYTDKSYQVVIPAAIAVILFFSAGHYDDNYYNLQPDWAYYTQYNSLRANLTDYPQFAYNENTEPVYEEVGWSENNVNMFRAWSFADKEVFPLEDLAYIVENIRPNAAVVESAESDNTSNGETTTILSLIPQDIIRGLLFILIIFLIAFHVVHKQERRLLLFAFFMIAVAMVYLAYQGRLPLRVFYPMFYSLCIISLFYMTNNSNHFLSRHRIIEGLKKAAYVALSLLFIGVIFIDGRNSRINMLVQERIDYNLNQLAAQDYIYVTWPRPGSLETLIISRYFSISIINPLTIDSYSDVHMATLGGWSVHSPHYKETLVNYGISNIYLDTVNDDTILLVALPFLVENLLPEFMEENYGLSIKAIPVHITDDIPTYQIIEAGVE